MGVVLLLLLFLTNSIREMGERFNEVNNYLDQIAQKQSLIIQDMHPSVTSNDDFQGEKSHFLFSPDRQLISFIQNVFEEYGNNWNRYWALKVLDIKSSKEKTLLVDDTRMSTYDWLDNEHLRVFHNAGTGLRVYLDISVKRAPPLFTREYSGPDIWILDEEYIQKAKNYHDARNVYLDTIQK